MVNPNRHADLIIAPAADRVDRISTPSPRQPALQTMLRIHGARTHNLRNLSLDLPKNKLIVLTGVSGSGKSSLAFDTLYAEGQRRYVESLSAYARQFLDKLAKPEVDSITGLTPAIAIEQASAAPNPRSTIATLTEIHDYLRILYSSLGQPHDPATGTPMRRLTNKEIIADLLSRPEGTRLILLAPVEDIKAYENTQQLRDNLRRQGFIRARLDGEILELDDPGFTKRPLPQKAELVIDRLIIRPDIHTRLADSLESARRWADKYVLALLQEPDDTDYREHLFPTAFINPETGFSLPDFTPRHFSFNAPSGACRRCHGLGFVLVADANLVVPDPQLSISAGAIRPWMSPKNKKLFNVWQRGIQQLAEQFNAATDIPYKDLPKGFHNALLHGSGKFEGLLPQLERLHATSKSEATRRSVRRFLSQQTCPDCKGFRLQDWLLAITLDNGESAMGIHQFCALSIRRALQWIEAFTPAPAQRPFADPVLHELRQRLGFLSHVGLGYLGLDRQTSTLSGGEFQRIRLATQIGTGLSGILYVLDEPSIGLHQRDNARLLESLGKLRDLDNTIIVVEHDEETIRSADFLVDIGPGAGADGGRLLFAGTLDQLVANPPPDSLTADYLCKRKSITAQAAARTRNKETPQLILAGARGHNLKSVDIHLPLGHFIGIAGVSGSGKSTLINDTLRPALGHALKTGIRELPLAHDSLKGFEAIEKVITIDQSPIGRSPRSNPATYSKAFDEIRRLFARLPEARRRGYDAGRFSFNRPGGRCEACMGDGAIRIDMHFLGNVFTPCEACNGYRYNRETLEVLYKGKTIADVLDMTIEEACHFFGKVSNVARCLESLRRAGLGYLRLGQPANTLSGGEAQRLKLATELAKRSSGHTLYLLDEPTTGLHFHDIQNLLNNLFALRDNDNTVVVIEHNLDVLGCCDWIIELGPEGGNEGGYLVAEGPPHSIAANTTSPTGKYLASKTSG